MAQSEVVVSLRINWTKREALRMMLVFGRMRSHGKVAFCEGRLFLEHACQPPLSMNEVIYQRNVFQKLTAKEQEYFWDPRNCAINCQWFHEHVGHTRAYRKWFKEWAVLEYGTEAMLQFLNEAPLTILERL